MPGKDEGSVVAVTRSDTAAVMRVEGEGKEKAKLWGKKRDDGEGAGVTFRHHWNTLQGLIRSCYLTSQKRYSRHY
jgi:hypothetical protein